MDALTYKDCGTPLIDARERHAALSITGMPRDLRTDGVVDSFIGHAQAAVSVTKTAGARITTDTGALASDGRFGLRVEW